MCVIVRCCCCCFRCCCCCCIAHSYFLDAEHESRAEHGFSLPPVLNSPPCPNAQVRPYLIADGGNVDVVSVEGGRVFLQLQVGMAADSGRRLQH